jgi:hypothetical protein
MVIDQKLAILGFKQITNFQYNVGNCLFDAIPFLKNNSITPILTQINFMFHIQ